MNVFKLFFIKNYNLIMLVLNSKLSHGFKKTFLKLFILASFWLMTDICAFVVIKGILTVLACNVKDESGFSKIFL